jgi:catechol 2,3-dioxygenase-like lactoylglutathione lyase family enzyme
MTLLHSIDHVNIVVEDLDRVSRFFIAFGFELQDQSQLSGEWISRTVGLEDVDASYVKLTLPGDTVSLELIQFRTPPTRKIPDAGRANTAGFRHLAFRVTDIEAAIALVREQGIEPFSEIQEYVPKRKKLVYFRGPEDILLELAQYGAAE